MERFQKRGGFGGDRGGKPRFKKEGFGRPSFSKGGREHAERELFQAKCSNCHTTCEVPFRPSSDRPVFCKDCFQSKNDSGPTPFVKRESFSRPFEKRESAPIAKQIPDPRIDTMSKQIAEVSAKLDMLLDIFASIDEEDEGDEDIIVEEKKVVKKATKPVAKKKAPSVKKAKK